jgi:hypothetical protein
MLYHPLSLISNNTKRTQIHLLTVQIIDIKKEFNTVFTKHFADKEAQIDAINEKSKHIVSIQQELGLESKVFRPHLVAEEIVDSCLRVDDSEVKSERVMTAEERVVWEKKQEELRIRSLQADDSPQRALTDMMNGTLEEKKGPNLLEVTLVREPWMDTPQEEWTDEQQEAFKQYTVDLEAMKAEIENRKKLLLTDLAKCKTDVAEICKNFDHRLMNLIYQRVQSQNRIFQIELIIIKRKLDRTKFV